MCGFPLVSEVAAGMESWSLLSAAFISYGFYAAGPLAMLTKHCYSMTPLKTGLALKAKHEDAVSVCCVASPLGCEHEAGSSWCLCPSSRANRLLVPGRLALTRSHSFLMLTQGLMIVPRRFVPIIYHIRIVRIKVR